jgi:hypothetical protein
LSILVALLLVLRTARVHVVACMLVVVVRLVAAWVRGAFLVCFRSLPGCVPYFAMLPA